MRSIVRAKLPIFIIFFIPFHQYARAGGKPSYGTITFQFINVAGTKELQLDSGFYTNASGENFTVTDLQYFISNIVLTNINGSNYVVPQDSCYFLIDEEDSTSHFCSVRVPAGVYKSVSFIVGVDSLRNTMDIDKRTGVLDPTNSDMYWQWNSGYICLKIEGICAAAPADPLGLHKYRYHIGGYKTSTLNNIKTVVLSLKNKPVTVAEIAPASISVLADILKLFSNTTNISIAQHPSVMFNPFSAVIANNYASMFSLADADNK